MKKKQKIERKFGSFWICQECEGSPEFEHKDFMVHVKEVHGFDPKTTKGKKSVLMHMDGDTWFSWDYEWEINGLKFTQHTCTKRSGDDAMMWGNQG